MALVHMLPEAVEMYNGWAAEHEIERPFPVEYLSFFIGYLLVLGIDRVAAFYCTKKMEEKTATQE